MYAMLSLSALIAGFAILGVVADMCRDREIYMEVN